MPAAEERADPGGPGDVSAPQHPGPALPAWVGGRERGGGREGEKGVTGRRLSRVPLPGLAAAAVPPPPPEGEPRLACTMFNVESLERAELGESLLTWVSGRGAGWGAVVVAPAQEILHPGPAGLPLPLPGGPWCLAASSPLFSGYHPCPGLPGLP